MKAAVKGDTKLEIDNSHEWEIGSKAIIGSGEQKEEKFVIGLGSIILSAPLERSYGAHTLVQMYTPGKDEREQFNKAQAILCVHAILGDIITTASNEGERVVRGRAQQQRQDREVHRPGLWSHDRSSVQRTRRSRAVPRLSDDYWSQRRVS